jgi:hypothetical protein
MAKTRRSDRRSKDIPFNPQHTAAGGPLTFHVAEVPSLEVQPTRTRSGAALSFHVRAAKSGKLATAAGKPRRKGA